MKIDTLLINNFRGISRLEARNLGDTVIIAGQNGSGKSCIFDAIRLLKSSYGGYQQNEWQQFFGEFAIQLHGGARNLSGLFNDIRKSLVIECYFRLRDSEKAYVNANAAELLETTIWQTLLPEAFQWGGYQKALFANQFRERQPEVTARVKAELPALQNELMLPELLGKIEIFPNGNISIQNCRLLSVLFANYRPRYLGVIDFHGAQRHYGREIVQGINLSLEQSNQQQGQHTLYNYNNKYNNVKSEMAGNFIKELLAEKAIARAGDSASLSQTLKELFEAFFPEKKFLGPQPTPEGSLSFPVVTPSGAVHDLDELSSGEKEILYGYLRIRSSAPLNSIILLDEPELHLNPRLIRGLPEFYRKHLGEALQNQLWLVTHSDALIREAVGKPGFNVYHMLPCGSDANASGQLRPLSIKEDIELVLADLVGDLAAYRPGGKGLLFEGGGNSDFDKTLASVLFREELRGINLISGANKTRVKALHEVLERAYLNGDLPTKFYSIVDRDSDGEVEGSKGLTRFVWDVYHIENYLLQEDVISDVLKSLDLKKHFDVNAVATSLENAARLAVPGMLQHSIRSFANSKLLSSIDLGFPPNTLTIGRDLHAAVERSVTRIQAMLSANLSEKELINKEQEFRNQFEQSFADGSWKGTLPGREILKQFVALEGITVGYEVFRNLIVTRMGELGRKPIGMKKIIDRIAAD
ncbi:AAA family ATPase [Hyphomicrobium sp. ghe19]|uniref:AAA family ATPase n=1 Tax=Hyphomicrobium sp. ghe19 TaxID=2682968 RepID=UPI001366BD30|nr:DNA replication and repair protein RecF [Hyphomicrobium sp. ghe19]